MASCLESTYSIFLFFALSFVARAQRIDKSLPRQNPFRKPSKRKKKKQQLDIDQLNEIEIVKPLKPQEKQNGVYEKQNG